MPSPPGRPARSPGTATSRARDTRVSAVSLTARSAIRACRHIRWNRAGRTAIGSPTAAAPAISGTGLGEDLQQETGQVRRTAPRVTVTCQPRDVRHQYRIRDTHPPETPPGQPARFPGRIECLRVLLLDPVIGTHVDDNAGAIGQPGEQIRRVTPGPARVITPAQPERLRRDRGHPRIEVQQHHMVTLSQDSCPTCTAVVADHHKPGR